MCLRYCFCCGFLYAPVRREFYVFVCILRCDSCALSVFFGLFILCALCMHPCVLFISVRCVLALSLFVCLLCALHSLLRSALCALYSPLHFSLRSALCTLNSALHSAPSTPPWILRSIYPACYLFWSAVCFTVMHLRIFYDVFVHSLYRVCAFSVLCLCICRAVSMLFCAVSMYFL